MNGTEPDEDEVGHEPSDNAGINLAGGPVTNTGAIVTGSGNRVTVRRSGIAEPARDNGRGHPLVNTGGLVSGERHEVEIEDSGDPRGHEPRAPGAAGPVPSDE
ncbi:hypothetical protein [Streptomyces sp. SID3343]|uniref:hypothetical protein n=1 Tax=Streptomyces sp. SID3343 TaxID=2690260 RepID=UPI00136D386E|nr:hypothetical protein [Streptomyces sp. SID3343]MYV96983.1 hypothetical protein [Streptomyces sp. SID3343]